MISWNSATGPGWRCGQWISERRQAGRSMEGTGAPAFSMELQFFLSRRKLDGVLRLVARREEPHREGGVSGNGDHTERTVMEPHNAA